MCRMQGLGLMCMDTKALHCFAGRQTHNMERDNNITKQQVLDQNKSTLQILTLFQTVFHHFIIIRQPLCPVVGRRPQHAVSKLPCLVLSSAISCHDCFYM